MTNRKYIFCAIVFLAAMLLSSCDPVPGKTELDHQPTEISMRSMSADMTNRKYVSVSFDIMDGITAYDVRLQATDGSYDATEHVDLMSNTKDGRITVNFFGVKQDRDYTISLTLEDMEGNTIVVSSPKRWHKGISYEKPTLAHKSMTVNKGRTGIKASFDVFFDPSFNCLVEFMRGDEVLYSEEKKGSDTKDNRCEVKAYKGEPHNYANQLELPPDTIVRATIGIPQSDGTTKWLEDQTAEFRFPKDILKMDTSLFLSLSKGKLNTSATPSKDGKTIELWHFDPETGKEEKITERSGGGDFEYPVKQSFQRGYFFLKMEDKISNLLNLAGQTKFMDISYDVTQDHVDISWLTADEKADVMYRGVTSWYDGSDGRTHATISNLKSNTAYSIRIGAYQNNYRLDFSSNKTVTTPGFEGKYKWTDTTGHVGRNAGSFVINVVRAPEKSAYSYYVYTASDDPKFDGEYHRISPLFDESMGEVPPTDDNGWIPYTVDPSKSYAYAQKAYRWNSEKWNSSKDTLPSRWKPGTTTREGDNVHTKTTSEATIGSITQRVETDTKVIFRVSEAGKPPKIDFINRAIGGLAPMINENFLNINWNHCDGAPNSASDAPWTYDLDRIGDPEQALIDSLKGEEK